MRTIAHISDLHFGREDPVVAEGLVSELAALRPDLVVNSGDLTQRARRSQFRAAAAYLRRIPSPQLTVPGNHDVPLFDVARRFLTPLTRYRRFICDDLAPLFCDDEIAVLGLNTARSSTWKEGRVSLAQIGAMSHALGSVPSGLIKAVVTHHPFIPPPGDEGAGVALVGRAKQALTVIERQGVDLLLAGHVHHGYTGDVRTYYPSVTRSVVVAQAGTAISHRIRREPNGYNLIEITADCIRITVRRWAGRQFADYDRVRYRRNGGAWERDG
ncbi:hypothetical protein CAI21_14990 [Alkalilimnicola ehrlichii]|uniref:Calcineurin-like phosphoesterase domain-containing protein n=1 Tax=Alkalilimnicola ehrlichii TaxID=351052 RepID=A0A3E0WPV4_9GAMM|nr:metallophosphoesterase family protein [Alkalilimnicola ehrlichii]RFA27333.1 hypothetical protein CAI21_14990 [Alkalilimnicola ehrlichii]RFA34439.1 hypothetical protein CAL65_15560 [Alkalilimnicola ehrlichii]